ncbi:MAG: beta-ribofuranosylaminobenzene 5'-phosphate synthase family protein [Candidatus Methylomirabilaceae bacterium]
MRVTVRAPARLHFGFIDPDGSSGRIFGSIGLAIEEPSLVLEASPADRLIVEGDEAGRARALAQRFLRHYGVRQGAHISVKEMIPAHVGLGSGTQLALGIATALARLCSIKAGVRELAAVMGRGARSGIGIATFDRGGFIIDGGQKVGATDRSSHLDPRPPTIVRHPFPEDWTFVVAIPRLGRGLAGQAEDRAFRRLAATSAPGAGTVSRTILMQMLPALLERDPVAFGRGLTRVQRIVGGWFRPVQGGTFANPLGARIARAMARAGALGVGQSSWGPAVYGMAKDEMQARKLEEAARTVIPEKVESAVFQARGNNRGAKVSARMRAGDADVSASPFRLSASSEAR